MTEDKLKQYIALFGGLLSALVLFLRAIGIELAHFNDDAIEAFTNVALAAVPFILVVYGIYKNTYVITKKARAQEEKLKEEGLK